MNKTTQKHLENVTLENFLNWKSETFHVYASCTTKNGKVELGSGGYGNSITKHKGEIICDSILPHQALEIYKKLVEENQ